MTTTPSSVDNKTMDDTVMNHPMGNIVAESDLKAALKGIEDRLAELKKEAGEKKPGQTDIDDAPELLDETYHATLQKLLSSAEKSLSEHVLRIVRPVSDKEYFSLIQRCKAQYESDDDDRDDEESSQSSNEDDDVWEDEYDEEGLLDKEAIERARKLRAQVREAADRVRGLHDSVKEQAVAIATREVELLMGKRNEVNKTFDQETFHEKFRRIEPGETSEKSSLVLEMEQSLASIVSSVKGMDLTLPENIKTFHETLETIQESLGRQKGGPENLSQTERAIISRDNEGLSQNSQHESEKPVPPQKSLASFLALY